MHFFILETSRTKSRPRNMFHHLTWLFSDSVISRELGPDMVPKSWDPDYEKKRIMCAEVILERLENEELNKASAGILIRLFH